MKGGELFGLIILESERVHHDGAALQHAAGMPLGKKKKQCREKELEVGLDCEL